MHFSHLHYLPLGLPFFSLLVALFLLLVVLIQLQVLRYAYLRLGLSSGAALFLLFGSLIGSYFNIPVGQLPDQHVIVGQPVSIFGMTYLVPVEDDWPGTLVAVNIGGALIPAVTSGYLVMRYGLWVQGGAAVVLVAIFCHLVARLVPGLGIVLPPLTPALAAAVVALLLSRERAAALAYVGGSLGVLIGADLMNLGRLQGLDAPIASIGGAGTFDGIFLTGIVAVLIASLTQGPRRQHTPEAPSAPPSAPERS